MALTGKDLEAFNRNKIDKIKKHIRDTWDHPGNKYEAFAYLIDEMLDDVRKDFLSGSVFYKNAHANQVSALNDKKVLRSAAHTCGLTANKFDDHLAMRLSLLEPKWLIDVPKWNGVDQLRTICFSTEVENATQESFYQHVLAWGAGIFARARDSYFQNQAMILRGDQGIGKDFFVKTICKGLGPYLATWTNTKEEREIALMMQRGLVLNIPEFDNTHRNEVSMLKAIITKASSTFRKAYDVDAETVKLHTSFISSANVEYLLRDSTGNRRYLIFVIKKFGMMNKFDDFDSLQILAQFKDAFERGFKVEQKHVDAMNRYIGTQTPQPIEEQVIEFWNDEIKLYRASKSRNGMVEMPDWIAAREVAGILERLRKEFGLGRNHISLILTNRGCKMRRNTGFVYRGETTLSVVKSDT